MPSLVWINQFALLPADGGGTRHFELGRELVRRGWRVSIFASDFHLHSRKYTRRSSAADRAPQHEIVDGVQMHWLWAAAYTRNDWRRAWNWLTFYRSVQAEARNLEDPPGVIIGSSPQIFAAVAARKIARRWRVPFVFEVRDLWPESLVAAGGRRGVAYRILDHVATGLYRDSQRILVLAGGAGEYLVRRGLARGKIVHVPNGVDVTTISPPSGPIVNELAVPARPFTVIYAGAHGPANGLEAVLEAAEILGSQANIRFILVGDGPAKAALRTDATRRRLAHVDFVDPVGKRELASLLTAADAGLMVLREAPLFSFGVSPNKLFDYLAAGLPVVCNVPGEVASMVGAAGAGIQVANSSGAALAEGIRKLASMPAQARRQQGQRGREWVAREHSREVLGEKLDAYLREVMAQ
jgi:glycosyltransferase involved in cell wall biosynthesis